MDRISTPTPRATSEMEVPTDDDRVICIENSSDNVMVDDGMRLNCVRSIQVPGVAASQILHVCHPVANFARLSSCSKFGSAEWPDLRVKVREIRSPGSVFETRSGTVNLTVSKPCIFLVRNDSGSPL